MIHEHIRTARPVASGDITGRLRLNVSPATIRNEMLGLDDLGYLEQPHTSAGRTPTDKGYRFFVDELMRDFPLRGHERSLLKNLFDISGEHDFAREFAHLVSRMTGSFAEVEIRNERVSHRAGFAEVLEEPEFQEIEAVKSFGRLVDSWDDVVEGFFEKVGPEQELYIIGEENPLPEARFSTMIISRWTHPEGYDGLLTIIGPKRTNYPRHHSVLGGVKNHGR